MSTFAAIALGMVLMALLLIALFTACRERVSTFDGGLAWLGDEESKANTDWFEVLREWGTEAEEPTEFGDVVRPLVDPERPARLRSVPVQRDGRWS